MNKVYEASPPIGQEMARGVPGRWLVVFNCQGQGLANCLQIMGNVSVDYHDHASILQHKESVLARLDTYDRVIVAPWVEEQAQLGIGDLPNVWHVPPFYFDGYQPDFCWLTGAAGNLIGPLGNCQSIIARTAYLCELSESQAVSLYREDVYARLGYFAHWHHARELVISQYAAHGFDVRQMFVDWSRRMPFVHMGAHPKIFVLNDIARMLLDRDGLELHDAGILPHDNLVNGPVFPVYPEIASRLGLAGNYTFKCGGKYETMKLEAFVGASFRAFADFGEASPTDMFQSRLSAAINFIKANV